MNQEITAYITKGASWQIKVCQSLRDLVHKSVPEVEERFEYGKPHFLKNGQYVASIYMAKEKITFVLFNASVIPELKGVIRPVGDGKRKAIDIKEDQNIDDELTASILRQIVANIANNKE